MKFGTIVYHVANPKVAGVVVEAMWMEHQTYVKVFFERAVCFTGNPGRYSREWECSRNLLCMSSDDAVAKHDPNHKTVAQTMVDAFDGIREVGELDESLKKVTYDESRIKLQPMRVLGVLGHPEITEEQANCDHDWVTWTGLKGTITDCTKCKRVK